MKLLPLLVPWQTEYRNKCEFLISTGASGEEKTIGFRLGKYKGGSCAVVGPADTCHVSAEAKRVVCEFQKFIRYSTETSTSPTFMSTDVRLNLGRLVVVVFPSQDDAILCLQS